MKNLILYLFLFFVSIVIILAIVFRSYIPKIMDSFLEPTTWASKVAGSVTEIKQTDGRTNFLLIGIDQRTSGPVTSVLTDTMMVISIDQKGKNAVVVSIPRDLWVEETRTKINAVYAISGKDIGKLTKVISNVVGLPIHYHAIVGFDAFVQAIDAVGGVKINVDKAFDDYRYPIEGKENAEPESARYEHLRFSAGEQSMNGETALKYARSRHSLDPYQGGDFARARRQQQVMVALKDKILSTQTLANPTKLLELYNAYKDNVKTDFNFAELPIFYDKYKTIDDKNVYKIVLSDEQKKEESLGTGMLKTPNQEERDNFYNGQYVLIPYDTTFNEIHALVRTQAFKEEKPEEEKK